MGFNHREQGTSCRVTEDTTTSSAMSSTTTNTADSACRAVPARLRWSTALPPEPVKFEPRTTAPPCGTISFCSRWSQPSWLPGSCSTGPTTSERAPTKRFPRPPARADRRPEHHRQRGSAYRTEIVGSVVAVAGSVPAGPGTIFEQRVAAAQNGCAIVFLFVIIIVVIKRRYFKIK